MSEFSREMSSFVEIARCKSIREAADRLNVASSALSRQMRLLEQEFGVQLLVRNVRGVELTEQGRVLQRQAEKWLEDGNELRARLSNIADAEGGRTRLGAMECFGRTLVPELFKKMNSNGFRVRLDVKVSDTATLLEELKDNALDFVIAFNAQQNRHIRILATFACRIGLVYSTKKRDMDQRQISVAECLELPLYLPSESLSLHTRLYAELLKQRMRLDIVATSNSVDVLRELVLSGSGVTFLTWFDVYDEVLAGRLGFIPLSEKRLSETLCLCAPGGARMNRQQDLLLRESKKLIYKTQDKLRVCETARNGAN